MIALDLTGRAALVTGGARGIGAEVCRVLTRAGAGVAAVDNSFEGVVTAAMPLAADVRSMADLCRAAEAAAARFGRLDILVTCAGTTSRQTVEELSGEEWERIVGVNLTGTFNAVKAALPHLLRQGAGAIVLVGSAAIVAGSGGGVHYAASKSALEGLCRGLTRELAGKGIRTNLVHPSLVDTELLRRRHPDPATREKLAHEVPIGRLGRPADIAHMVAFLASDLAGYITGQSIFVDGGRTFCK
jgi:3-oxoacyl-[acyl-carrier protein] reductase